MTLFHIGVIGVTSFIMLINLFAVGVCVRSSQISQSEEKYLAEMDKYIDQMKAQRLPRMNDLRDTMTGKNGIVMKSTRVRGAEVS